METSRAIYLIVVVAIVDAGLAYVQGKSKHLQLG